MGGRVKNDDEGETTWFTEERIIRHLEAKNQQIQSPNDDIFNLEECGFDAVELQNASTTWAESTLIDAQVSEEDKNILVSFISAAFSMGLETGVNLERQRQLEEMFQLGE